MLIKRLPAEWEPQAALLLTWPHEHGDWGNDYEPIESVFLAITQTVASEQKVIIGVYDFAHQNSIMQKLEAKNIPLASLLFYLAPSNDVWARDHGPITVFEAGKAILCDFKFNAWGKKYDYTLDDQIPGTLYRADILKGYGYEKIDFILEGGAIETDGQGTLLTTAQCLTHAERNSQFSKEALEKKLQDYLGVDRILWLDHGKILGDDTDGHIDTLARFIDPHTIAYVRCDNKNDPQYGSLREMENTLQQFKDRKNQPYRLVPLPLPDPIFDSHGKQLPATYANFLMINQKVLVPVYQCPQDEQVIEIFKQCYPNREIVGIDCLHAIEQFGSLHCLTMQIPSNWVKD